MTEAEKNGELWVFAPNVREGGGAILLDELIAKCPAGPIRLVLPDNFGSNPALQTDKFGRGLRGRIAAELKIFKQAKPGDIILCFNGSVPLFPSKARILVYIQNTILLEARQTREISLFGALRVSVERLALRLYWKKVEMLFVQTKSMKMRLQKFRKNYRLPEKQIQITPFFKKPSQTRSSDKDIAPTRFFYPALFHKYKNHYQLFVAWEMFVEQVPEAKLIISLEKSQLERICAPRVFSEAFHESVDCLGKLTFEQTQEIMAGASALVFPSKTESFGMPLLEASSLGVPIIASERDYVRDVCNPDETFDPNSALSIFRALMRFSSAGEAAQKMAGAENLWRDIGSFWKNG